MLLPYMSVIMCKGRRAAPKTKKMEEKAKISANFGANYGSNDRASFMLRDGF